VLNFFVIGFVIGVVLCIPIGVANVAVIDAAYRHGLARAIMVGAGGAIADGIYASVGIFGVGPFLERYPTVPYVLYGISGIVLVIYGFVIARAPAVDLAASERLPPRPGGRQLRDGFVLGLAVTLLNPSAITTWLVIVGSYATGISAKESTTWVLGIVIGSMAWFVVVAYLANHGKRVLSGKAVWMTRGAGILVLGYGLVSLGRAGLFLASAF
jgi:L-lysine exporter family protein LysE/ArgO